MAAVVQAVGNGGEVLGHSVEGVSGVVIEGHGVGAELVVVETGVDSAGVVLSAAVAELRLLGWAFIFGR
jgi:hypothetical protein